MLINERCPSDLSLIPPLLERTNQAVMELTGSFDQSFKIKLALEEALTNAMRHGNGLKPGLFVDVIVEITGDTVTIDVRDQGPGFDSLSIPDPTVTPHVNRPSGRGIFLMRRLMDNLEYYDQGRGVRMKKTLTISR